MRKEIAMSRPLRLEVSQCDLPFARPRQPREAGLVFSHFGFLSAPRGCEKYFLSEDNGFLDQAFGNEWEFVREPGADPAFERANPGDSFGSQQCPYLL